MPVAGRNTLIVAAILIARTGWAQFSPGPLSKAHASLSGPAQCTSCHAVAAGERRFKCLQCHTEIRERLAARRGLHASLVHSSAPQGECARCHSEHNGESFVPIRWDVDLSEFDHGKTGYPLEGAHRRLECGRCHAPQFIAASERRKIRVKDLRRTYLGLSRQCIGCHEDIHRGQVSADCSRCHTLTNWKPASGFDHAKARFQLTGVHEKVVCAKCHRTIPGSKPYIKFTGLEFRTCTPCHNDPHRGAFAARCESCHTDSGWKSLRVASHFDHSRTNYPLLGKHGDVSCGKCHRTANFKEPVAHARCVDCHSPNAHDGQFLARADRGECATCHVVDGWRPARFGVEEHRVTRYPLEARHAAVACAKCHIPAGAKTIYRVRFERCSACHLDIHKAQFSGPPHDNRCEDCHTVRGFRPSTFTLARHTETRYRLEGAHAAIPCSGCHASGGPAGRFRFADHACETCHADPHAGQFRTWMAALDRGGRQAGCESCHSVRAWSDVSKFDHSATRFALAGTHRAVPCAKCHRPRDGMPGIRNTMFRAAPVECAGCHEDIHGGQFAGTEGKTDCARCHAVFNWTRASRFDHDRESHFALTGAHRQVACGLCHTVKRPAGGKLITMYRLAPHECSGCHGSQIAAN